jgi:hypothetical protein
MSMILLKTGPAVIHAMFTIPNVALENAMATRVFRAVALGVIKDVPMGTGQSVSGAGVSDIVWRRAIPSGRDRHMDTFVSDHGIELSRAAPMVNVHVEVSEDNESLGKEAHDIKSHVHHVV